MGRLRLDRLLVARGLFDSRAKARAAIEAGGVTVDGAAALRPSQLVEDGAAIEAAPAHPYVGRGALKLIGALDLWPIEVSGRLCLDIGASTGGFTEILLERGATKVVGVDVGKGQLHPRLAADPRVETLESFDARRLTAVQLPQAPDLIVCDVSFISLAKALPAALALAGSQANLIALVKPQFEVGPGRVGKGGVVRDAGARTEAVDGVQGFLRQSGWVVRGVAASPIAGADGNQEMLLWATKAGVERKMAAR